MAEEDSASGEKKEEGLRRKMHELNAKLKDTTLHKARVKAAHFKKTLGKFENIVNPNHRHDEEHEKATDEKRSRIASQHRFRSFAPEREGNKVKWYIDGRDYFWALSIALERATETIYIADWWLSPELFLRRPPYYNQHWRLDQVLKRRAEAGVKIYVIVYQEVEAALSCNSRHTKNALRSLCPPNSPGAKNINIMRHPDHSVLNPSDVTLKWAHHEKFVVIDYNLAFIGGIDLCFGRWDTRQHQLADVSPRGVEDTIFPGQDFNNNRIMDFKTVQDWMNNELSKAEHGRMPWHDVHMGLVGPCVYDIAEHFVARWNFSKRDKYKRNNAFDWLILEGREGDDEDLVAVQRPKFPEGKYIQHPLSPLRSKKLSPDQGTVRAQIVRSCADWSCGTLVEQSIQNAYKEIIQNARSYIYIENQFFVTATGNEQSPIHNTIGESIVHAVVEAAKENRKFRVIIVLPAVPGFAGDLRDDAAAGTRAIMEFQYRSLNRGDCSIYGRIQAAGFDPKKYIFVFNLRSYDRINFTPAMREQEERSGVKYHEVQRANAEEIMANALHGVPGESSDSEPSENESKYAKKVENQRQTAFEKKQRFEAERENVGLNKFNDVDGDLVTDSADSIAKDAMMGEPKVFDELWNNEYPQQENENFVQEQLYPHDKVLIVDDQVVICGSSNINDRSQYGHRDSELSIVMEDTDKIDSKMDGKPYKAGRHAATLRKMLWREHLGLLPAHSLNAEDDSNAQPPEDCDNDSFDNGDHAEHHRFVEDPLDDKLWETWTAQATTNTEVFRDLFHVDPDDTIKTFQDYDEFLPRNKVKQGHLFDPSLPVVDVRNKLSKIKGHLVWMPLDFLKDAEMAETGVQVNYYTESIYT